MRQGIAHADEVTPNSLQPLHTMTDITQMLNSTHTLSTLRADSSQEQQTGACMRILSKTIWGGLYYVALVPATIFCGAVCAIIWTGARLRGDIR